MELQMLTSSCLKLQTVHHVPLSINKEGQLVVFYSFKTMLELKSCIVFSLLLIYLFLFA